MRQGVHVSFVGLQHAQRLQLCNLSSLLGSHFLFLFGSSLSCVLLGAFRHHCVAPFLPVSHVVRYDGCYSLRFTRRSLPLCAECAYVCDGDANGVLRFIGTSYGTQVPVPACVPTFYRMFQ